jgi:hypothetical protein
MEYNRFDLKNPVGTGGNNTDMLSAALNGQFDLGISLPVNPSVFAGGGFDLLLGLGTSGYGSYNLEWDPAIQAGAGIEFLPAAEVGFFAEARYHLTFRTGGNFSFVPVQAGMRFLIY